MKEIRKDYQGKVYMENDTDKKICTLFLHKSSFDDLKKVVENEFELKKNGKRLHVDMACHRSSDYHCHTLPCICYNVYYGYDEVVSYKSLTFNTETKEIIKADLTINYED